jgi:tRNA A37 threonylcarbamoyladenosine biosynthesis protein TsaE
VALVARLAHAVEQAHYNTRVVVAIDGSDAAGKTALVDAVARQMARRCAFRSTTGTTLATSDCVARLSRRWGIT